MSPAELFAELHAQGVELWAEGDRLRYRGPSLTEAQREALRAHKPALLDSLRTRDAHRAQLERACDGTAATPDDLWALLSDADHADIADGYTPLPCLQHMARRAEGDRPC